MLEICLPEMGRGQIVIPPEYTKRTLIENSSLNAWLVIHKTGSFKKECENNQKQSILIFTHARTLDTSAKFSA